MNLLLLLSALLSALSGMGQAVRSGRAPEAVCASVAAAPALTVRKAVAGVRPALVQVSPAALPSLVGAAFRLSPIEPIFAGRRRE